MNEAKKLFLMNVLGWSLTAISWRSVAVANIPVVILVDTVNASLNFFVLRSVAETSKDRIFLMWFAYTSGGVLGTVIGIYISIFILGK